MKLFALDLSRRVGWARFAGPTDPQPKFGTYVLPKPMDQEDIAKRTLALRFWLREMLRVYRPHCLAFEAPWIPMIPGNTTQFTLRLQVSLACEVETTAAECEVPRILEVPGSVAKLALTGSGRIASKDKPAVMVRAAQARGWAVGDDHQADAGAVALAAYDSLTAP